MALATARPVGEERHRAATERLLDELAALPADAPVRLGKRTSNLFRQRTAADTARLDVSDFTHLVDIDPVARTARVQGMTTYEELVDATLPHGLMPLVVPQLRTITLGGAVTGLGIEASSFRSGLPHESVLELEILTGSGEVVVARPEGEHAELFRTFPNSYGSLGYALAVTIELEPVQPYVLLHHVRFHRLADVTGAIGEIMRTHTWAGEPVDFLDGVVFAADEAYLTLGRWSDTVDGAPGQEAPSDYTGQQVFYRSIQQRERDVLTVRDFLWRWDTDWFWCSRAFGAQQPLVRRLWPKRKLRSDVYWKIVAFENRHRVMARLDARRGKPPRERVVQDVEIPLERTAEFVGWFLRTVPIEPVWLCPVRLRPTESQPDTAPDNEPDTAPDTVPDIGHTGSARDEAGETPWPLYPMAREQPYVNVGFWSTVPIEPGRRDGDVNRSIEDEVGRLGGHKSLYSDSYYDEKTFDRLYGGSQYRGVKRRYDPLGRLPTLYDKAVRRR